MLGRFGRQRVGKLATLTIASVQAQSHSIYTSNEGTRDSDDNDKKEKEFDLMKRWEKARDTAVAGHEFLNKFIFSEAKSSQEATPEESVQKAPKEFSSFEDFFRASLNKAVGQDEKVDNEIKPDTDFTSLARDFVGVLTGGRESKERAIQNLIQKASRTADRGDISDHKSFSEMLSVVESDLTDVSVSVQNIVGDMDLTRLSPVSLMYYVEHEDERKNPSWKRRMHRFHYGIDIKRITHLNDLLGLASLSYADTLDDIANGLQNARDPMELIFCELESASGKPSHFIAIRKDQPLWSMELEVILVVRGTKTLTDVVTDCIAHDEPFKGGRAHAGILKSGQYLVEKHKDLFESLRKLSRKRRIKLRIVGHSLGAGAATIAGMEFHDMPNYNVEVVGFGCPALVSEDLSLKARNYITTVVSDSDLVPRMSAATVANVLLDILEHDYIPMAKKDIEFTFQELLRAAPGLLSKLSVDRIMNGVDSMLETYIKPNINPTTTKRYTPVLFPPGTCVHLYRDGSGVSGTIAPCTFFNEIDVTRRMIDDHLIPSGYQQVFLELMRQYYQDQYFRFDETDEIRR